MTWLSWLADRLILCPSTHSIDPGEKRCEKIPLEDSFVEAWIQEFLTENGPPEKLAIVKFPGTAGRAERSGVHPAELLPGFSSQICAINPPGYGGSPGPASVKKIVGCANAVYEYLYSGGHSRILVTGNSLGCLAALYLAANYPVDGMLLRNPPPIHQLIKNRPRYSAWSFGLSSWIADEVPIELDAIENADRCSCPCLFVQSEKDRIVPVKYQDQIIGAYQGAKQVFRILGADHHEMVGDDQAEAYVEAVAWLNDQMTSRS